MIAQKLKRLITYAALTFVIFTIFLSILILRNLNSVFELQSKEFSTNVSRLIESRFAERTVELQRMFDFHKSLLDRLELSEENIPFFKESLISNLKRLGMSFIAFYSKDGLIQVTSFAEQLNLDESQYINRLCLADETSFPKLTGRSHFFFNTTESIFPVEAFVIFPSPHILKLWNIEKPSVIVVGKIWTISEIIKLEELSGASISYLDKPEKSTLTKIVYSHELLNDVGKPTGYLIFSKNFTLLTKYLIQVIILVGLSILVLVSIISMFYIRLKKLALEPFTDIIYAIDNHTPDTVEKYIHREDEIGNLANTIKNYLHQREQINLYLKELESKNQSLRTLNEQIQQLLEKDVLTGLLKRYVFNSQIERLYVSSKADRIALSAISIDADNFKKINDTYGHNIGDEVLKGIADVILKNVRSSDFPIRMGGEEILILLPEADANAAFTIAERIRVKVEERFKDKPYKVTISLGVTQLKGEDTIESFLKRADEALYMSKENGKNRTTVL
jgi:diguanylate cyclase (GGDEF)-like protein